MKKFSKKHIIIYAVITLLILIVTAFSFKTGNNVVSNAMGTIISPVQSAFSAVGRSVKNAVSDIVSSGKNARDNEALRDENTKLKSELRMVESYKAENDRLRSLLELRESRTEFKSTAANVIGKESNELRSIITIDKGSKHGVEKNSVVLVSEGLVGNVFEVGHNYAKVKTIFDAQTSVSAICLRSGDMGIIESAGFSPSSGRCSMNYIDRSAKTVVGDIIETSGTGGIFPRGIVIGKITEIKEDNRNLTLSAVIESGVNINSLDTVLVSVR